MVVLLVDGKEALRRRSLGGPVNADKKDTDATPELSSQVGELEAIAMGDKDDNYWKRLLQDPMNGSMVIPMPQPSPRPPTNPPSENVATPAPATPAPVTPAPVTPAPVTPAPAEPPINPTPRPPTTDSEPTDAPPTESAPTAGPPVAEPSSAVSPASCQTQLDEATSCIVAGVSSGVILDAGACTACVEQALQPTDCSVLDALVCVELANCPCGPCTFTSVRDYAICFAVNNRSCPGLSCNI